MMQVKVKRILCSRWTEAPKLICSLISSLENRIIVEIDILKVATYSFWYDRVKPTPCMLVRKWVKTNISNKQISGYAKCTICT